MAARLTLYLSSLDRAAPARMPEVLQQSVWRYLREAGTVGLLSEAIEPPRRLEVSAQAGFWIKHFCVDEWDTSILLTFRNDAQSRGLYKYREGQGLERISVEPIDAFCVNSAQGCVYAFRAQQLFCIRHRDPPYNAHRIWTMSPDWSPPGFMVSRGNHIVFGSLRREAPKHCRGITVLTLSGQAVRVSSLDFRSDMEASLKFRRMLIDAFQDWSKDLCTLVCIGETLLSRSLTSDTWHDMKMRGQVRQMATVQSSIINDQFRDEDETAPPLLAIVRHSSHNLAPDSEVFYLARFEVVDLHRSEIVVSVAWLQTPWCPNLAFVEHAVYFQACGQAIDKGTCRYGDSCKFVHAQRRGVPASNPFGGTVSASPFGSSASSGQVSGNLFAATAKPAPSPFGAGSIPATPSPFGGVSGGASGAFGSSAPSPFGGAAGTGAFGSAQPSPSPFGNASTTRPSPFGSTGSTVLPSPFGGAAAKPSPFGQPSPAAPLSSDGFPAAAAGGFSTAASTTAVKPPSGNLPAATVAGTLAPDESNRKIRENIGAALNKGELYPLSSFGSDGQGNLTPPGIDLSFEELRFQDPEGLHLRETIAKTEASLDKIMSKPALSKYFGVDGVMKSASPFGVGTTTASPFGDASAQAKPSPFGTAAAQKPSPFRAAASPPPAASPFGGFGGVQSTGSSPFGGFGGPFGGKPSPFGAVKGGPFGGTQSTAIPELPWPENLVARPGIPASKMPSWIPRAPLALLPEIKPPAKLSEKDVESYKSPEFSLDAFPSLPPTIELLT
ncbi:Katanin p60 ATPase-containing subunit A1 [Perkinsus olseni]|uniref:Katanin p60 ATPase-containing subunit A1 n=1 Tax=Perkinsus olseni TaxID=32597 RepID=A0A7J6MIH0_PEROL|nr:Katanin p60 ATPase-containing subunit A1 [Perkinsus olseni]KAF4676315.1 Katanin p60 ATPase-containing subunit A1 [Perkinsus olseni]